MKFYTLALLLFMLAPAYSAASLISLIKHKHPRRYVLFPQSIPTLELIAANSMEY